jgi:hypothetical protein
MGLRAHPWEMKVVAAPGRLGLTLGDLGVRLAVPSAHGRAADLGGTASRTPTTRLSTERSDEESFWPKGKADARYAHA